MAWNNDLSRITSETVVFWFRRDLRMKDNAGLYHALREHDNVVPIFIFDTCILGKLDDPRDARVTFIHQSLMHLDAALREEGSALLVLHGDPVELFAMMKTRVVFTNRDYEPYAWQRDGKVAGILAARGGALHSFKDQVIFEREEVMKPDGKPYTVFTPYANRWRAKLTAFFSRSYPTEKYAHHLSKVVPSPSADKQRASWDMTSAHPASSSPASSNPISLNTASSNPISSNPASFNPTSSNPASGQTTIPNSIPSLEDLGFKAPDNPAIEFPPRVVRRSVISTYDKTRNFPAIAGTTRLSVHLRFGTVSIRHLVRLALSENKVWLNELIWREFYQMILFHFPHIETQSFKPAYDRIQWRNDEEEFSAWCDGRTGYPLVDAGMRELNETGFMHNRVRMVTASFLTKHLLIDWRWGEAYFAKKLLDYDLASNNGGWQWASGSGCDSAPYFRVFNPELQRQKFDPEFEYVMKWVPEFQSSDYPPPIVDHAFARDRALRTYRGALQEAHHRE